VEEGWARRGGADCRSRRWSGRSASHDQGLLSVREQRRALQRAGGQVSGRWGGFARLGARRLGRGPFRRLEIDVSQERRRDDLGSQDLRQFDRVSDGAMLAAMTNYRVTSRFMKSWELEQLLRIGEIDPCFVHASSLLLERSVVRMLPEGALLKNYRSEGDVPTGPTSNSGRPPSGGYLHFFRRVGACGADCPCPADPRAQVDARDEHAGAGRAGRHRVTMIDGGLVRPGRIDLLRLVVSATVLIHRATSFRPPRGFRPGG